MKKIIFTSRLDGDSSLGAYLICEIAQKLAEKYPKIQINIIGGGTEYPKIAPMAQKISQKLNRELILPLGTQSRPTNFYDENTLFVGVSRAALEAMSCGSPVILLGNEGCLGLLDERKLPAAIKTNFTCRAHPICTADELFSEISHYYSLPETEKARLSRLSREIVAKYFSAEKMTRETLSVYREILEQNPQKTIRITLCGYYGKGNLGDEAILLSIKRAIGEVFGDRAKISILNTKNPLKMTGILRDTDLFVFGGGSLLQNSTSTASLFYYLAAIITANVLAKNKIMLANGIGPVKDNILPQKVLTKLIARAVDGFDIISVRDTDSRTKLQKILPHRKIHLVPDPALALFESNRQKLNQRLINSPKNNYFIYIPCARGLKKANITPIQLTTILKKLEKNYACRAVLCVLNPVEDEEMATDLPSFLTICPSAPNELCALLRGAKFVISQRYHGSLFAASCGVPTLSVSDDPKIKALCKDFLLHPSLHTEQLKNLDFLSRQIEKMMAHHKNNEKITNLLLEQGTNRSQNALRAIFQKYNKK